MEYLYNIDLCFKDNYDNFCNWNDDITKVKKIPIFKVKNIYELINNYFLSDLDYKYIIVSDGINSIGVEFIDYKSIFLSSLSYEDEEYVSKLYKNNKLLELEYKILDKREDIKDNKIDNIRRIIINDINNQNDNFIKVLYYFITDEISNDILYIKDYLINDVNTNFSLKYINVYEFMYD